jgi:hypothetical protein
MPADYADERYNPSLPHCGSITLKFDGEWLTMQVGGETTRYHAVSGRPTSSGFLYDEPRQHLPREGPIPAGTYWIRPSELQVNAWYRMRNPTSAWGNYWITIHPFMTTETFTRGGFFIHGGDTPGSAGCIDLWNDMNRFAADLQRAVGSSTNCQIHLVVRYAVTTHRLP